MCPRNGTYVFAQENKYYIYGYCMKNQKWYLQTWFICIIFSVGILGFAVPVFFIFSVVAVLLIILQYKDAKRLRDKYGNIDEPDNNIHQLESSCSSRSSSSSSFW